MVEGDELYISNQKSGERMVTHQGRWRNRTFSSGQRRHQQRLCSERDFGVVAGWREAKRGLL